MIRSSGFCFRKLPRRCRTSLHTSSEDEESLTRAEREEKSSRPLEKTCAQTWWTDLMWDNERKTTRSEEDEEETKRRSWRRQEIERNQSEARKHWTTDFSPERVKGHISSLRCYCSPDCHQTQLQMIEDRTVSLPWPWPPTHVSCRRSICQSDDSVVQSKEIQVLV